MLNLDTHILIHALAGDLSAKEDRALRSNPWSISAIVLWEIAMLERLRRIQFDWEDPVIAGAFKRIHVWPLTIEICRKLAALDIRGDPVDELIAATSLAHKLPLVTRDNRIRKSKLLDFAT